MIRPNKIIEKIGKDSLLYYVVHGIIIIVLDKFIVQDDSLILSLFITISIIIVPYFFPTSLKKFIVNPFTINK